ncbi:MAG TPA: IPT/TIG domain-containing protein [Acidimicrobiales bacterium]|nr:IPT/TIG domain-containing protein [Acidimicrobiales bacterium]
MTRYGIGTLRRAARRSARAAVCLGLITALAGFVTPASAVSRPVNRAISSVGTLVAVGSVPSRPIGAQRVGLLATARVISLGVVLVPRDPVALSAFAQAVSMPRSPLYHRYLAPGKFAEKFGPSKAAIAAVERELRTSRLRVGKVTANGLIVPVTGTVGEIDAAFRTRLVSYRLMGGMEGWAPATVPRLPERIAHSVSAVLGLDNLAVPHALAMSRRNARSAITPAAVASVTRPREREAPEACAAATATARANDGWTEDEIAQAYGLNGLFASGGLGEGQTIAVLELEPFDPSDLVTFDQCFFGPGHAAAIQTIPVDGFDLHGSGTGEAIIDLEVLTALAPEAHLAVYEAPNTSFGPIDAYNAMVSADKANIISTSWGACETSLQVSAPEAQQVENYIFEEAAAQGQTVFASSGDTGSDDCAGTQFSSTRAERPYLSVDDPASQPYVVAVGGTSLRSDTSPLGGDAERVWNDGASGGGTGGGISNTWASPVWQAQSGVPGVGKPVERLVPDVSSAADEQHGLTFYSTMFKSSSSASAPASSSGWSTLGGTSISAPTWAAIIADIASSGGACASLPVTAGGRDLGFVAPELYAVAVSSYGTSFNDITIGDNDVFGLGLGYAAGSGYDLASGLGSPNATDASGSGGLATALCAVATASAGTMPTPSVTGITPDYGPTSGGNVVTLTGTGFATPGVSLHVEFGTSAAAVDSVSPTSITVTAPSSAVPPRDPPVDAAGAVEISITATDGSTEATSPATEVSLYDYVAENSSNVTVPSVAAIGPPAGNIRGGRLVTIWGSGFAAGGATSVSFGGVASPDVRVLHAYEIKARVPAESSATACANGAGFDRSIVCQVQVVVTTPEGTSATASIRPPQLGAVFFNSQGVIEPRPGSEEAQAATEYDYVPKPKVTLVAEGKSSGSPVRIFGSGFSVLTFDWVNLGPASSVDSEQTKIDYVTPTSIIVTPTSEDPTGSSSAPLGGGVSVQTAGGLSNVVVPPRHGTLKVRRLSALGGSTAGGTELRISGSGLAAVRFVAFAGKLSPPTLAVSSRAVVTRVSGSALTVRTPAHAAGPVDVLPCSATSCALADSSTDTYVYVGPAVQSLVAVSRLSGPASGGTRLTLFGRNADEISAVLFGSARSTPARPAPGYPRDDPYVAQVRTPPGTAGARVSVTTLVSGRRGASLKGATYRFVPSAPSPPRSVGMVRHGAVVILRWSIPASDGGSPITSYTVAASTVGLPARTWRFSPGIHAARLAGLVPDRSYVFAVAAWNATHGRGLPVTVRASAV